jgi:protoheme IX farnesyltransferase
VVVAVVSLTLPLVSPAGALYTVAAFALGAGFVGGAERLRRDPTADRAIRYFAWSNAYLALLFAAVAIDTFLRHA